MLHSFTWQQFLVAALILSSIWYLVVWLAYCKGSLKNIFPAKKGETNLPEPLKHYWDNDDEFEDLSDEDDLLGKSKLPEGVSNLAMSEFGFAPRVTEKEDQLGLVPDVLEELKRIFNILANEDGNKSDFFSLLELVKAKYPQTGSSPGLVNINRYIQDHAPFHLTAEELENLWD